MSLHHVINTTDLNPLERVCIYCSETCEAKWDSEFHGEHHYKVFLCEHCDSVNFLTVKFHGSGHDQFGI